MAFWIFMVIMDMLIPVAMAVFGYLFLKKAPKMVEISVPQGYNASRYQNCMIFYNSSVNYNIGITKIKTNDGYIKVYELERSICDIIKNENF